MRTPTALEVMDAGARLILLASALIYVIEPLMPRRLACRTWGHQWLGVDAEPVCRRCGRWDRYQR